MSLLARELVTVVVGGMTGSAVFVLVVRRWLRPLAHPALLGRRPLLYCWAAVAVFLAWNVWWWVA